MRVLSWDKVQAAVRETGPVLTLMGTALNVSIECTCGQRLLTSRLPQ